MAESKKSKKAGRNQKECQNYRTNARREVNKAARLIKVLKRNPNDTNAAEAFNGLSAIYQKAAEKRLRATGYKPLNLER
jgi:hypothetical protein